MSSIDTISVVMLVFDFSQMSSFQNIEEWKEDANKYTEEPFFFLVGTKKDIVVSIINVQANTNLFTIKYDCIVVKQFVSTVWLTPGAVPGFGKGGDPTLIGPNLPMLHSVTSGASFRALKLWGGGSYRYVCILLVSLVPYFFWFFKCINVYFRSFIFH